MSFRKEVVNKLLKVMGYVPIGNIERPPSMPVDPYSEGVVGWYSRQMQIVRDRRSAYYDFEQIADFVLGASALEMYAEDAFPWNHERGATTWVTSNNPKVTESINDLNRKIDIESVIPSLSYTAAMYGDSFDFMLLSESGGVEALKQMLPSQLTRIDDEFGRLVGFAPGIVEYFPGRDPIPEDLSRPWDILHTRIMGFFTRTVGHGTSMLTPVRYIWRQLKIMLDSMVLYRWTKGAAKYVYYVDVGTNPIEKQMQIVNMWRLYIKKKQHYDPKKGIFDQEWNPESLDEDLFWPLPKDSNSRIDVLNANPDVKAVADIDLYVNLFFSGLRIPKAFMGFEGDIGAREVLPYQSIRYANVAYKLQRAVLTSLIRLYQIHNTIVGLDPLEGDNSFKVHTSTISHLYDVAKSELLSIKMDMMGRLLEFGEQVNLKQDVWLKYILKTFVDLDDDMVRTLMANSNNWDNETDSEPTAKERDIIHKTMKTFGEEDEQAKKEAEKTGQPKRTTVIDKLNLFREMEGLVNPTLDSVQHGTFTEADYKKIKEAVGQNGAKEQEKKSQIRAMIEQSDKIKRADMEKRKKLREKKLENQQRLQHEMAKI